MSFGFGLGLPHWYTLAGGFTPASLFGPGQIGVWYNPNDPLTLFTTSDGTTQCATPGSGSQVLVGLMLDKSQGLQRFWSGYFDGAGDWLGLTSGIPVPATGTFTIEAWVYAASATDRVIWTQYSAGTAGRSSFRVVSNKLVFANASAATVTSTASISLNTWTHVAVTRDSSNNLRLFINGNLDTTSASYTASIQQIAATIGAYSDGTDSFSGYISNFRITNTAVYTGNFTPPSPVTGLTAISGTSLLTCQNATFIDNSSNAFAITVSGNTVTSQNIPLGNHAIAFNNTTARPELSARVNLLTYSEQFDNAAWSKENTTIPTINETSPIGTATADVMLETAATGPHLVYFLNATAGVAITNGVQYAFSCRVKPNGRNFVTISNSTSNANQYASVTFDLTGAGSVTQTNNAGTFSTARSGSIVADANGFYVCTLVFAAGTSGASYPGVCASDSGTFTPDTYGRKSYAGDVNKGLIIWGADLRVSGLAPTVPTYQRIADQYTYNASGFPRYLIADGSNDSMYTPATIPFATVTSDGLARRNLLTLPTQFDASAWTLTNVTVTPNSAVAPDGTTTADLLQPTATSGSGTIAAQAQTITGAQGTYTVSYRIKPSGFNWAIVAIRSIAGSKYIWQWFNLASPAVGSRQTSVFTFVSASIVPDSNGYYVCTLTATTDVADSGVSTFVGMSDANNNLTATASGSNGILVWGAQLETGSTATAFQNIGTDNMSVFTGLRRLSDAAQGMVVEYSATTASNNGSFSLETPSVAAGSDFQFISKGTVANTINADNYPAPLSAILSDRASISPASNNIRVSGLEVDDDLGTQGTGVYGTYQLFLFARNNASAYFNGYLYQLIVRGAATSETQTKQVENWLSSNTGIALDTTPVYDYVVLDNGDFVVDDYGNNVFIEVT